MDGIISRKGIPCSEVREGRDMRLCSEKRNYPEIISVSEGEFLYGSAT